MGLKKISRQVLLNLYQILLETYGPRHWWPGDTPFEVAIGAILTQNTSWKNVERAIQQLKAHDLLDPPKLSAIATEELAQLIRSSGYYNQKAKKIKEFLRYFSRFDFEFSNMDSIPVDVLRDELLAINGIGPETADSILLYALEKPIFVIDAYTKRMFSRLGFIHETIAYGELQGLFMQYLPRETALFNEYHALIVCFSHHQCKKKPLCGTCFLRNRCYYWR